MPARARALLAALGVPVWGARGAAVTRVPVRAVWQGAEPRLTPDDIRTDQPVLEQSVLDQASVNQARAAVISGKAVANAAVPLPNGFDHPPPVAPTDVQRPVSQPFAARAVADALTVDHPATTSSLEQDSNTRLRFAVQARVIGQWIVCVPEDALMDEQARRLWDNIGIAMQAQTVQHFAWPLAEGPRWQRMDGAAAALAGFLFRLSPLARVGLMGHLPDTACPDRIERLPALSELLADPLQKRTLWQLLAMPYHAEDAL